MAYWRRQSRQEIQTLRSSRNAGRPQDHHKDRETGREGDGDKGPERAARAPSVQPSEGRRQGAETPERQHALNPCIHQGGEGGGGPLTQQRAPTMHSQGIEGDSHTRQRAILECNQGTEEEGRTPTQ